MLYLGQFYMMCPEARIIPVPKSSSVFFSFHFYDPLGYSLKLLCGYTDLIITFYLFSLNMQSFSTEPQLDFYIIIVYLHMLYMLIIMLLISLL